MIRKIRTTILTLGAAFALLAPVLAPTAVFAADIGKGADCGVELEANQVLGGGTCGKVVSPDATQVDRLILLVINIFSLVVGTVSVIMIIIGGLRYVISGGDSSNVSSAKNTILYAIVGLVIVVFAQVIVRFVLSRIRLSQAGP